VGRPFDDKAGLLLRRCLLLAGVRPEDCLLSLLVRCATDPPKAGDAAACSNWLAAELAAARPKVVVALGATAARLLTKNKKGLHGNPVILTGPSHHGLPAGGRTAEAVLVDLFKTAKEAACSTG
jgi:uracil-DNA glycosylase